MTKETPAYPTKKSRRFVDLAFDCMFINEYEKEETLKALETPAEEDASPPDAIDIFQRENLISAENIEFLIAFDAHLQTQAQDRIFGQIATANGMAPANEIEAALEYQKTHFNQTGISLTLGDILVDNKIITPEDRISILLTQDRIKNEHLLDALNDLGKSQVQKDAVNKRFGVVAIKNGMATREQVNEALEIQKSEAFDQKSHRFIGKILQEITGLADKDILQVIEEQRQFEKRRLDLEKALYPIKSEIKISKRLNRLFEYTISRDRVEAFATKKKQAKNPVSVYEFLIWIKRVGIRFGIVNDAVLEDFIQNGEENATLLVAKGNPPEPPVNERLELYFQDETSEDPSSRDVQETEDQEEGSEPEPENQMLEDQEESEPQTGAEDEAAPENQEANDQEETGGESVPLENEEDQENEDGNQIIQIPPQEVIKKGSILARIIPGAPGKSGRDVLGHAIHPTGPAFCQLNAGRGVTRKDLVFFAQIDGWPVIKHGNTLLMDPAEGDDGKKIIKGDIKEDTQKTHEKTTLEIKGDIRPGAVVRCRSLQVHGKLLGSVVCSGDIEARGEIGRTEKQGDAPASGTEIICLGSVQALKPIINSRVQIFGRLSAFHSPVIGSDILACKGMTIKDAVNGEDKPSTLQFGLKPGDRLLGIDQEIATQKKVLSVLKKESEVLELTQTYQRDLAIEEEHQAEQAILKNLLEILQAPELDLVEGLDAKIEHLYRLPEFSSIRTYYLKLPETDAAWTFINTLIASTRKMTQEEILDHIRKKIDSEPGDEEAVSETYRIETEFKARLAGLEQEVDISSEEIHAVEDTIRKLEDQRIEQAAIQIQTLSRSTAVIKIKNKCERGTVIKGKIARRVVAQTVYHVKFKEVQDPRTKKVSIIIDAY